MFDEIYKMLEQNTYSVHVIMKFFKEFTYKGHKVERQYRDILIAAYAEQHRILQMQERRLVSNPRWVRPPHMSKRELKEARQERKRLRREGKVEEPKFGYVKEARFMYPRTGDM